MSVFLFTYRVPNIPLEQRLAELGPESSTKTLTLWDSWLKDLDGHVRDRGQRVSDARKVGTCDGDMRSSGYTVVTADSLDEAVALAATCPLLARGGGIEVGVVR
jgi:hypothetical protein